MLEEHAFYLFVFSYSRSLPHSSFRILKQLKIFFMNHHSKVDSADRVCLQVMVYTVFTQVWPYSTVMTVP